MIRINRLSISYQGNYALKDISLNIRPGESVLLTGPSGCGKSTLAKSLTGLIPKVIPAEKKGEITIGNIDIDTRSVAEIARHVGLVFQIPSTQLFHLKVEDEIAFGPRNLGLSEEDISDRVEWGLNATGLTPLRHSNVSSLSGGQKQHVAIAATLAMYPQVLILDEPTASLDSTAIKSVTKTLSRLKSEHGVTILTLEHRVAEILDITDRVIIMDQGRIVKDNSAENALRDKTLRRRLGLRRPMSSSPEPWWELISETRPSGTDDVPLLELRNVTAGYEKKPILKKINLKVFSGDFLALVGENGAGKTTLGALIAGLLNPSQGEFFYRGKKGRPKPGSDVTLLFQNPLDQLITNRVYDEVSFAARNQRCFDNVKQEDLLIASDLSEIRDREPSAISVGQQQRTALASCLLPEPRTLILDEPTLGQDWWHLRRLMSYIARLNDSGTTIILITHDFKLAYRYARRGILLRQGKIVMDGVIHRKDT